MDQGYYRILLDGLLELIMKHAGNDFCILDAGCGEGWYTANIDRYLKENHKKPDIFAVDISKDALTVAAKRSRGIEFCRCQCFPTSDERSLLRYDHFAFCSVLP